MMGRLVQRIWFRDKLCGKPEPNRYDAGDGQRHGPAASRCRTTNDYRHRNHIGKNALSGASYRSQRVLERDCFFTFLNRSFEWKVYSRVYRALLVARIRQARQFESICYLRVDALPTSRPILEKYGFKRVHQPGPRFGLWHRTKPSRIALRSEMAFPEMFRRVRSWICAKASLSGFCLSVSCHLLPRELRRSRVLYR